MQFDRLPKLNHPQPTRAVACSSHSTHRHGWQIQKYAPAQRVSTLHMKDHERRQQRSIFEGQTCGPDIPTTQRLLLVSTPSQQTNAKSAKETPSLVRSSPTCLWTSRSRVLRDQLLPPGGELGLPSPAPAGGVTFIESGQARRQGARPLAQCFTGKVQRREEIQLEVSPLYTEVRQYFVGPYDTSENVGLH